VKHIRAFAFEPGVPPARLQLWNVGDNPTDYGVHRWTERSIKEVCSHYEARGNPLQIDIEHAGFVGPDGQPLPSAGMCSLELENGAPVLVFDWSAVGAEQIATKQRRFLSPEYFVDEKTGEITGLVRVSLVADPGTHNARILASAGKRTPMDPMVLAALKAALTAEDPKAAIEALLEQIDAAGDSGPPSSEAPEAAAADPAAEAPKEPEAAAAAAEPAEEPKAAAAPPATPYGASAPVAASAPSPEVTRLSKDLDGLKRDNLLREHGERLEPGIRVWASRQSFTVVKGLIDALPKGATKIAASAGTRPTLGEGQGGTRVVDGSAVPQNSLAEQMGIRTRAAAAPYRRDDGAFVVPTNTPTEVRARIAARSTGVAK